MLTPQQLNLLKSTSQAGNVSPSQAMTPEQAQAWIRGETTPQAPTSSDNTLLTHLSTLYGGGPQGIGAKLGSDISAGAKDIQQGNVVKGVVKAGGRVAGDVAGTIFAPVAEGLNAATGGKLNEAFSGIEKSLENKGGVLGQLIDKITNLPAVQEFAMKHSNASEDFNRVLNVILSGGEGTKIEPSTVLERTASQVENVKQGINKSLTPAPKEAPSPASVVEQQKATATQAHDLIDKEVRDIAEKYGDVGKALNNAEVTRGSDPIRVLSSYPSGKALPSMTKGGKMNAIPAMNFLKNQISYLGKIKENLVGTAKENTSLEDFKQAAFDRIDKSSASAAKRAADKADVAKIIDSLGSSYPDGIPTTEMDKIKTEQANESKSYNSKSPFSADSHAIVGQTAADAVVTQGGNAPIDELNKLLTSHYDALKVLKAMQGKTPHGGMFSRHVGGIAGEVAGLAAGMAVGHPFIGAMAGRGASEFVNNILSSHFITNPLKRSIIQNMPGLTPEAVQNALKFLEENASETGEIAPTESTAPASPTGEKSTSPNTTTPSPKVKVKGK